MAVGTAFEWFRTNLTLGAVGIYALLGTIIGGWIKLRPAMTKLANEREYSLLAARGEDMDDMKENIRLLTEKVETLTARVHESEMKLVSALAAYRLIASDLAQRDPDSPILKQAQELLNVSYSSPRALATPADALRKDVKRPGANQ